MHHGIYIMGCIWWPFWILQEKVGISCYFCIIRVVNTQLSLYIHVRWNPLATLNTPKHPHMIITNFNYESSYLPLVICYIFVKADLGRCPCRCTPQNTPQMTIINFNYEGSYLPGLICNIVDKADLGRSAGRWTYFGQWTAQNRA